MSKKVYICFIVFTLVFFFSSVIKTINLKTATRDVLNHQTSYQDVTKMLLNIKTYATSGKVTYISNNETKESRFLQYAKRDGAYRLEVLEEDNSKTVTIYDTKAIFQFNDTNPNIVNVSTNEISERSEIFLSKFIKNYETSNDVSVLVSNLNENVCTVLEAKISGNHKYLATEKLYVDNYTMLPIKLVIYDDDGLERIIVEYEQFIINPNLGNEIFKVTEK